MAEEVGITEEKSSTAESYNSRYGMRDCYIRGDYNRGGNYYYNNGPTYQNDRPRSFGNQQRGNFDGPRNYQLRTTREFNTNNGYST